MLTSVSKRTCATCHMIWSHACCVSVKKGQWANKALNYQTKMLNSDLNKAITLMKVDQSNYDAKMTSKDRIQSSAFPNSLAWSVRSLCHACSLHVRLKIWLQFFLKTTTWRIKNSNFLKNINTLILVIKLNEPRLQPLNFQKIVPVYFAH